MIESDEPDAIGRVTPTLHTNRYWPDYRAIWRWHFYAGLFCIPFVILLSLSGMIYLFSTEIETFIDRPWDRLNVTGSRQSPSEHARAAIRAVPGSRLQAYVIPESPDQAVRVIVNDGHAVRVYVHPATLQPLHQVAEESRLMRQVFRFHGELMMGDGGSHLVELASSWTIVMILTGLCLWWPRGRIRLGGVLYPRWARGSRVFWRDTHAVSGFWVSAFALILLLTGLPWAKFWGDGFRTVRKWTGTAVARQEWDNSSAGTRKSKDEIRSANFGLSGTTGRNRRASNQPAIDLTSLDRIFATVEPLELPPPVVIAPPGSKSFGSSPTEWTAKSLTPNRPKRVDLTMNPQTGEIAKRSDFSDKHIIDRIVGTGIALHEGRLFGWPNQAIGLLTAVGLVTVSFSSIVLWLKRKRPGSLGAPAAMNMPRITIGLLGVFVLLGTYLPLFGISAIAVVLLERTILVRIPRLRNWLGLGVPPRRQTHIRHDSA